MASDLMNSNLNFIQFAYLLLWNQNWRTKRFCRNMIINKKKLFHVSIFSMLTISKMATERIIKAKAGLYWSSCCRINATANKTLLG
jgi:hypothetical protein